MIEKVAFKIRSRRIVRDRARDIEVVRVGLRLLEGQETQPVVLRSALVAGEDSGEPVPFDFDNFVAAKKQ